MDEARALLADGDVAGALRQLRQDAADAPLPEVAGVVASAAAMVGFDDLRAAAEALTAAAGPQELYEYGYACIERGVAFLAVPALEEALAQLPDEPALLVELVAALQHEERHGDVVARLEPRVDDLPPWPFRYLLGRSSLLAGDVRGAAVAVEAVPPQDDEGAAAALTRLRAALARARTAATVCPLDRTDLRGWHYVLTGGVLATLSPYGFDAGMTGRWAFVSDSLGRCRTTLDRVRAILEAADVRPTAVGLLPDRSSRVLGLAAAQLLDLPAAPLDPQRPDTLVVAYQLDAVDEELLAALHEPVPGQVLVEHATCWTDPPLVSADITGFLHQHVDAPWGRQLRVGADGDVETGPADDRPTEELAAAIVAAEPDIDPGDGATPPDPVTVPAALAAAVRAEWPRASRGQESSPGPVPSSRFA
ncbi:hypothetical protein ACQEVB_28220 [Pseudonocardia sp. CA-107938]|uniref:hypothetical protein n=1 Tax=Pseudonocardia sp. CA-107938 TaxID=3240021 RepID=UPI003D90CEAD